MNSQHTEGGELPPDSMIRMNHGEEKNALNVMTDSKKLCCFRSGPLRGVTGDPWRSESCGPLYSLLI